jgi:hypothetical protein
MIFLQVIVYKQILNPCSPLAGFGEAEFKDIARQFFQTLWQRDFISIGLSGAGSNLKCNTLG